MLNFSYRIVVFIIIALSFIKIPETSAQPQKNYLEGLFQEIEVREKHPEQLPPRLHDKLIEGALSFKLLSQYPHIHMGKLDFLSHYPQDLKGREDDIKKGQDLILNRIGTPAFLRESVTFKDLINQIDRKFHDPKSQLQYTDWVLMASAFRTLRAPDSKTMPNALGVFVTEYIILMLIDDLEKKPTRTREENELLSTLYYILSQLYQNIINNPEDYSFIQKKKQEKNSPLYFALPQEYYTDVFYENEYITPITGITINEYDIPYDDPYAYSVFISFDVTYDILVSLRLDLLRTAVIVTPYYDVAWVPIIEYISVDLWSPFYRERLSPIFWDSYFPVGLVGIEPIYIDRLRNRWDNIVQKNPRALTHIKDSKVITNSLQDFSNPKWRAQQERLEKQGLQERFEGRRLQERQEQRRLQREQKSLQREERRGEQRLQQEQRRLQREERRGKQRLQQEQRRLQREERRGEQRLQGERQQQQRLQQEQRRLQREERREAQRLQGERQQQQHLQQEQKSLQREERRERQEFKQRIETVQPRQVAPPPLQQRIERVQPPQQRIERVQPQGGQGFPGQMQGQHPGGGPKGHKNK